MVGDSKGLAKELFEKAGKKHGISFQQLSEDPLVSDKFKQDLDEQLNNVVVSNSEDSESAHRAMSYFSELPPQSPRALTERFYTQLNVTKSPESSEMECASAKVCTCKNVIFETAYKRNDLSINRS